MWLFLAIILLKTGIHISAQQYDSCNFWGDPHLTPFRTIPSNPTPNGYWCRRPGNVTLLISELVEVDVYVTQSPYLNEKLEIRVKRNNRTICTIRAVNDTCSDPDIDISRVTSAGASFDLVYPLSDPVNYVHMTVAAWSSRTFGYYYNIVIELPYSLVNSAKGQCTQLTSTCRLESITNGRRKRGLSFENATAACNEYIREANIIAQTIAGNTGSELVQHAQSACINDITLTEQPDFAISAMGFILVDAIRQSSFNRATSRQKILQGLSVIPEAAERARIQTANYFPRKVCLDC